MQALPSGLPEHIADAEDLSRFLTQKGHFNSFGAKPAAFLPNPKYRNTSVFRLGNEPDKLRQVWRETTTGDRDLKGVAICRAKDVRIVGLDVLAKEPPPAHANIEGWPWHETEAELQKAQQLELASHLASASEVVQL